VPLAHRETAWKEGVPAEGEWIHYAHGPGEMPSLLVGGDGTLLARLRASVWGRLEQEAGALARTPLRYPGQDEDVGTGLFYNRYRFYDPTIGLYISPDPIGLMGGLGAYEYARAQPFRFVDPLGLNGKVVSTVTGSAGTVEGKSGNGSLHSIV